MSSPLEDALGELDDLLAQARPDEKKLLRPPASEADLRRLEATLGALPHDLHTWFSWHDGQEGMSSIVPDEELALLSIDRAIAARAFLQDSGLADTQLPIFANGSGDYVVYDLATGGALIRVLHDDPARVRVWGSLLAWAREALVSLEEEAEEGPPPAPPRLDLAGLRWDASDRPAAKTLAAQPLGTVYRHLSAMAEGPKRVHLLVKIAPSQWLSLFGLDEEAAIATYAAHLAKRRQSGFVKSDAEAAAALRQPSIHLPTDADRVVYKASALAGR